MLPVQINGNPQVIIRIKPGLDTSVINAKYLCCAVLMVSADGKRARPEPGPA